MTFAFIDGGVDTQLHGSVEAVSTMASTKAKGAAASVLRRARTA